MDLTRLDCISQAKYGGLPLQSQQLKRLKEEVYWECEFKARLGNTSRPYI